MASRNGETEFTTISLSQSAPAALDRRTGQRYMTVLQAGKLVTGRFQELCLIRNISSGGMMAEIFAPVDDGEQVGVEFKAGTVIDGVVRWVRDGRSGIEFFEKIDVHEVLAPHRGRMSPRSPRLDIDGMATLEIEDDEIELPVLDISQGGIKVSIHPVLEPGLDLIVNIEGLPLRASAVRWTGDEYAGIAFNNIMPLSKVAYWAARQQPK
ncbi:MAG: PilZ domain-containing protein [Sphingomonadaceae bacterium]|nr:PilZ domain-containing protein [Sphingomonadaceae bacterium]